MNNELDVFEGWPKIARLKRDMIITEKLDGTNAQISIRPLLDGDASIDPLLDGRVEIDGSPYLVRAGSRNKWIAPGKNDNAGFAGWVRENQELLVPALGEGRHFGEWWGQGIQRKYNMDHKRFSLFNVHRWLEEVSTNGVLAESLRPAVEAGLAIDVVPVLHVGVFNTFAVQSVLDDLAYNGSVASPGFNDPEGVVVFHVASQMSFKQTIKGDEKPKGQA